MNRRNFLKKGSLTGVGLASLAASASLVASCHSSSNPSVVPADSVAVKDGAGGAVDAAGAEGFALNEITIDELQKKMQSGEYTSRSITELYLKRIDAIDKNGHKLNAVIELNPDALAIADELDKERKAGKIRGALHGVPVLIKDNIDSGDKMMTTAGSLALEGHKAARDAFIIKRLRESGAVLPGKTNLSEWANFRSTRSTSGWSSRGGQTRNPCILERNPSGSSAGSGSAVAANLCAVAIGTETDGSVVSPSSVNGIVGIKPTVGLLSRSGIIPISKTQDTAGPMARTVKDAVLLLGALAGVDEADPVTRESRDRSHKDYTSFLDINGLKGKRIGVEKSFLKGHEGVVGLYQEAIAVLKKQGAEVIEVELVKLVNKAGPSEFTVLQYEFKEGLNKYLSAAGAKVGSLAEVIAFNRQNQAKAMPYFMQETLESSNAKAGTDSKEYLKALKQSTGVRKIIDDLMKQQRLDAIVGTTNGIACCIDLVGGDYDTGFSFSSPAAMAGYPHITVPMGAIMGLPIGFSFMAGPWAEPELIKMAYAFEQATRKRVPPKFTISSIPV
ncbi:MAG TPA: amidase [Puia sp.]|nr:amidase [Puia sp.]